MIRHTKTRWFSLLHVARRVIYLWDHLLDYFTKYEYPEKEYFVGENYLYIQMFIVLMGQLEGYNELFQSENKSFIEIAPKKALQYLLN